jgi:hypothetical protein
LSVVVVALLAAGGVTYALRARSSRRTSLSAAALSAAEARGEKVLRVPRASGPITLDGDTDDPGWVRAPGPAKTGLFTLDDGQPAVPQSQARIVWTSDYVYLALYASDEDVESHVGAPDAPFAEDDDAFHVVFSQGDTEYAFDVSPNAIITDARRAGSGAWDTTWNSGVHASRELGATVNDPKNLDEEWEVELAIPIASLNVTGEPGENIGVSFRRCDTPKDSARVCAGWSGWLVFQ